MIIHVFQLKDTAYPAQSDNLTWVAAVDVNDVQDAVNLTVSTNYHWSFNNGVVGSKARNTAEGDILITGDGRAFQVDWQEPVELTEIDTPKLPFASDPIYQRAIQKAEGWLADWKRHGDSDIWLQHRNEVQGMAHGLNLYTNIFEADNPFFGMVAELA